MSKIKGLDDLFGDIGKQPKAQREEPDDEPVERVARSRGLTRDDDDELPQEPAGFGAKFDREWKRPQRISTEDRRHPERGEAARLHRARMRNLRENPPDDETDDMQDDPREYEHGDPEQEPEPRPRARTPKAAAAYMPQAKTTDHCTPAVIGEALALLWAREVDGQPGIDLDPCASASGLQVVRAKVELRGPEYVEDGLTFDWCSVAPEHRPARVFSNCPYGKEALKAWVPKMVAESVGSGGGASVVGLLPAPTSSGWFHDYVLAHAAAIAFVRSRLKFVGSKDAAPFSSILPLWSDDPEEIDRFVHAFGEAKIAKLSNGFRALGRVLVLRR